MKKQERILIMVGILAVVGASILYFFTRKTGIGMSSIKTGTGTDIDPRTLAYVSTVPLTGQALIDATRAAEAIYK